MTTMQQFKLGAIGISASVQEDGTAVSKHSGRPLARIQVEFSASPANADRVREALAEHENFESVDAKGQPQKWSVETSNWSYTGDPGRSNHKFSFRLLEHEDLAVTELVIDDQHFRPYL